MQLTLFERVILSQITPVLEGNILIVREQDQYKRDIALTKQEIRKYKVHQEGSELVWKSSANGKTKNVFIPDTIKERIGTVLVQLSEEEKLGQEHLSLYDKFIGDN